MSIDHIARRVFLVGLAICSFFVGFAIGKLL